MGELHVLQFHHLPARGLTLGRLHAHVAGLFTAGGALHAHLLQPPHAAFVTGPPGLDALTDPHFLLGQELVEARRLLRLRMQALLAPAQIVVPVAGPVGHLAAVDLEDPRGQRAQEAPVMGDEHQRAGPVAQELLQPVDRGNVQMVGRLVEQQHLGLGHQRPGQQHPALEPARQPRELLVSIQPHAIQGGGHPLVQAPGPRGFDAGLHCGQGIGIHRVGMGQPVVFGQHAAQFAQAGCDHVEHAAAGIAGHLLFQPGHARAILHAHLAVIGQQLAGQYAQQGGFSSAIAPDQGNALSRADRQANLFEQQRTADADVDAFKGNQGHALILGLL